jgi:hypothetical protein
MRGVTQPSRGDLRQAWRILIAAAALLALFGLVWADSVDRLTGYALITVAALLPSALWLRAGAAGIPVLPAAAAFHYLYFAVPMLRENLGNATYTPEGVLRAAATVALFLVMATVASWLVVGRSAARAPISAVNAAAPARSAIRLLLAGLSIGILFHVALMSGWLDWLGAFFGVARAMAIGVASIACYILGHARARGILRGQYWKLALAAIALLIVLSWSSLFLVGGLVFALAAVLGYSITAKRIPWKALVPAVIVVFVLHAGKAEMRDRYWPGGYAQGVAVWQVPSLMSEWVSDGIADIASGEGQQDLIDRASLLCMLLNVERLTPDTVPYLGGETYALLPTYLTPRFLDPDKTFSQAGLVLLNIRYGIQTREGVATTTIGWGVISEAFANFGYGGVLGVGLLFGGLCGWFTRWSADAAPLSLPTLLSIAALISLTNLEADLAYILVNLWQALAATLLFFVPVRMLSSGGNSPSASLAVEPQHRMSAATPDPARPA